MKKHYDFIIAGGGAAGLVLVNSILENPVLKNKSVLIIDKSDKSENDRTWCFWEKGTGPWDEIIYKSWEKAIFKDSSSSLKFNLNPYRYKMIRGIDFYKHVKSKIRDNSNIEFLNAKIKSLKADQNIAEVTTIDDIRIEADIIFNSIPDFSEVKRNKKYPLLLQHFIGWVIETEEEKFDDSSVTFMDFSVAQKGNTRFMYVLPFSKNKALVEYTLFSPELLDEEEYEQEIEKYIASDLEIKEYSIIEKEKGAIPMTTFPFEKVTDHKIINIGTQGGSTKASTGFTFKRINEDTANIVKYLEGKCKDIQTNENRFRYYDMLLIDVLFDKNEKGGEIFSSLFRKNDPVKIFDFLDERTSISEELKIMLSSPQIPFLKSVLKRIFYRNFLS
ncbi:lycopene cyclase family protein [Mangrovivirga sp. M17]|uniref:Lycopene cyclase family protein n=1 Tax=Mangrovivirga halotolerans TaxID=2993936 RepID=A0ABT3RW29_9BACT|nr:lycopene cyclase family protein [Mangrovivirga halotolerans]MCX2745988.1 lycopene cyclase family protein [Mangrovivirga halotolerans]